jgi:formylmethanofuran dehydrogenase subunit C
MNLAVEAKMRIVIPTLAASGKFGGFKPETERPVRDAEIKKDLKLEEIIRAWSRNDIEFITNIETRYEKTAGTVKGIVIDSSDIERFCIALAGFQDEKEFGNKAGFFLSALVNSCKNKDVIIRTSHLSERINYLGFRNTKNVTIEGNAGESAGCQMKTGRITLNGDALDNPGVWMRGGTLVVNGNAGEYAGWIMKAGRLIIRGNAGSNVGGQMEGGLIRLEAGYASLSEAITGGKIFHKGQLIWPKGGGSE